MALTPAQRRAKLEAAKALMQEVEADETNPAAPAVAPKAPEVPQAPAAPTTKAAAQAAAQAAVAAKAPAAPAATPKPVVAAPTVTKAPAPVIGDQVAAHADQKQPSVFQTLMNVARQMKGQR